MSASLGEFGDMMLSMLPRDLAFTAFVPSPESFRRVLKLRPNESFAEGKAKDDTYAVVSRVLRGASAPALRGRASARAGAASGLRLWTEDRLDLRPIVKYSALEFFDARFLPALPRKMGFCGARSGRAVRSWLVEPLRDSNLQLFALVAVWIASKIHEMRPLAVKSLKALSDRIIADQHFTCRDFADAELVFMEVQLQQYN
ncbi:hypothetical protein ACQ4PT_062668 [Festuca glaucescens]